MLSFPLPVVITGMADTDGELGNLEPLRRGTSQHVSREFLRGVNWSGKTHSKCEWHHPVREGPTLNKKNKAGGTSL